MSVEFAFLLWVIILVIIFFILKAYRITWWSSLVFALIVSWIVLCLVYPMSRCGNKDKRHSSYDGYTDYESDYDCDDHHDDKHEWRSEDALFCLITLVTVVIVLVYIIQRVFRDREDYTHHQQKTMSPFQY